MSLVHPYDPEWPKRFEDEAARLREALGATALRIEHNGSTAVPGLCAKPVIDIQVSVARVQPMDAYRGALEQLGYSHLSLPEPGDDVYPFFHRPKSWPTTHHVHVCEAGGLEERRHLAFRDWLRAHPTDRDAYGRLKQKLADETDENDVLSVMRYTSAKTDFILDMEKRTLEG